MTGGRDRGRLTMRGASCATRRQGRVATIIDLVVCLRVVLSPASEQETEGERHNNIVIEY